MIYIPEKIRVGFCNRKDTYTGKLAYVIYYDEYGKLHKETSWEGWRDKNIQPQEFCNTPTEGFVLNKKVGGYYYHFDARQTYVRVYDPRGFEFEITVPNLLYILEYSDSMRGKGLDGSFVYGWEDKELVLVPTNTQEYKNRQETARNMYPQVGEYIIPSKLKVGYKYKAKCGEIVYMGKHDYYWFNGNKAESKRHFYFCLNNKGEWLFSDRASMNKYVFEEIGETPAEEYPDLLDRLEHSAIYSPIDTTKDSYVIASQEEFSKALQAYDIRWHNRVYSNSLKRVVRISIGYAGTDVFGYVVTEDAYANYLPGQREIKNKLTAKELYDFVKPMKLQKYLTNGNLYKETIFS